MSRAVVVLILWLFASQLCAQQLAIRILDVGQGDAALIREGGKTVLIDASPGAAIASYLRSLNVDTIDLVVASHNHSDHIGGMTAVLNSAVVRFYLDNGIAHTTATYRQTIQPVQASGAQYLQATNRSIQLGAATITILAPVSRDEQNNGSVGVLVEYGVFRALFTGDSEQHELAAWLGAGAIPRVSVLKVAHHGSTNGTSCDWIGATHPQVAVISVGGAIRTGIPLRLSSLIGSKPGRASIEPTGTPVWSCWRTTTAALSSPRRIQIPRAWYSSSHSFRMALRGRSRPRSRPYHPPAAACARPARRAAIRALAARLSATSRRAAPATPSRENRLLLGRSL